MNDFAERLKYLREEKGLTQKELAKICKVSPQCICCLEQKTRYPTGSTVAELARALGATADYLLGLEDDFGTRTATNVYSPEERKLIEKYRKLNASGKKLINTTFETLLTTAGGSGQNKIS